VDLRFNSPNNNPAVTGDTPITILRPPVVLVHGLWDSSQAWASFTPLVGDPRFFIRTVDYSAPVSGITASSPAFSASRLARARQSSLGFAFNAPNVLAQIQKFIKNFKDVNQAAAVQADIVAHSMGGDISRILRRQPTYLSSDTFSQGPLHKLITIGTPHLGTPLATQLLQAQNSRLRGFLALAGNIAFGTVAFGSATYSGGAGDLQGNGFGGALSTALQGLQASTLHAPPTATIAGTASAANLAHLNCVACVAEIIRKRYGSEPLAAALTATGWPSVFGQSSDAIVPRVSQLNGAFGIEFTGLVHSTGAESLSFAGPAELDEASGVPARVIDLLNESTSGPDFRVF
jgi:pimeloyl-ACP methyl ester carboxylesterase